MDFVLTHATVLDGTAAMQPQENCTVIVKNGTIDALIPDGTPPAGLREYDLQGAYLLPGLINLHAHLIGNGVPIQAKSGSGRGMPPQLEKAFRRSMERGVLNRLVQKMVRNNALNQLYSGVTTIRAVGDVCWTDVANRDRFNASAAAGPRLLVSGMGVSVPNGHMAGTMGVICRTEQEAVAVVQEALAHHADWIKLFVTGGVLDADEDGTPAVRMTYEMAKAACDCAHAAGVRVAAHAESANGVLLSLQARVDTIEHGAPIDEETLRMYREKNAALTVTLSPVIAITELSGSMTGMNETQRQCGCNVRDGMIEGAKMAVQAGLPVGLGTDCSCPYVTPYDMWREVYYFAKYCGVSPTFALHTATLRNAEILGIAAETGSIAVGKAADMFVVRENPLQDLCALRTPEMVIARGRMIEHPKVKHNAKIDAALNAIL